AYWDDTYAYMANRNERFLQSNFTQKTMSNRGVDVVILLDEGGAQAFGEMLDARREMLVPVPPALVSVVSGALTRLLLDPEDERSPALVLLPEGPMLRAAEAIVTSDRQGPGRGFLVFGAWLDEAMGQSIAKRLGQDVAVYRLDRPMPPDVQAVLPRLVGGEPFVSRPVDTEHLAGYALLRDVKGTPAVVLGTQVYRAVTIEGRKSAAWLL